MKVTSIAGHKLWPRFMFLSTGDVDNDENNNEDAGVIE